MLVDVSRNILEVAVKFAALAALFLPLAAHDAAAENPTEVIEVNGRPFLASTDIPAGVPGRYLYEKRGSPMLVLNADGTGTFAPHQSPDIPIRYWMQATEAGPIFREDGQQGDSSHRHILIVKFGPGGGGNYPEGGFDRFDWVWSAADSCAIILGERWKC